MQKLLEKLLTLGTHPKFSGVENRSISISNVVFSSLPLVYFVFMLLDINTYIEAENLVWDQFIVPFFILLCFFFLYLNSKGLSLLSRILFLISWPLANHIIPIIYQNTPLDYYLAFPIGLIFHAVLIQTMVRWKSQRILFALLMLSNILMMLYFPNFLVAFDSDPSLPNGPFYGSIYYLIVGILYWLLFNFLTFYLMEVLDYRDSQIQKRQDEIYVKNNLAGISFWEFLEPLPLTLSRDEQIHWARNHAVLKECNDRYARYYGYKGSRDVVGMTFLEILQNDEEVFEKVIGDAVDSGFTFFVESEEATTKGEKIWFMNWLVPTIEDGSLITLQVTQIDITKQKLAERSNEQLLEDLKEYAFLTSHKLRSPLASILGIAMMLDSPDRVKEFPELMTMLRASSEQMDTVIREMNDILSRNAYQEITDQSGAESQ